MAVIYQKVFSDGTRPYMLMTNEEWVRPLNIGRNWTTLRISAVVAIRSQGTSAVPTAAFVLGVCSGLRGYGDANTTHALGILHADSNAGIGATYGTWNYTAGSGNPYYSTASGFGVPAFRVAGVTYILSSYASASMSIPVADQGSARNSIIACEITKGATYATKMFNYGSWATATTKITLTDQINYHEAVGSSFTFVPGTASYQSFNGSYPTVNEAANGYFDSVFLYWNRTLYPLEVYSIMVSRMA